MVRTEEQENHKNPKAAVTFLIHQERLIPIPRATFNSGAFLNHREFCSFVENLSLIRQSWLDAEMLRTKFLQLNLPFIRKRGSSFVLLLFFFCFKSYAELAHAASYANFIDISEPLHFPSWAGSLDSLLERREGVKMGGLRAAAGVHLCNCSIEAGRA